MEVWGDKVVEYRELEEKEPGIESAHWGLPLGHQVDLSNALLSLGFGFST